MRLTLGAGRAPHGCVGDVMRAGLDLPAPETSVGAAMQAMTRAGLQQAPVVGADGRMAGIVALADLLPALLADLASAGDKGVREGTASEPRSWEGGLASSR